MPSEKPKKGDVDTIPVTLYERSSEGCVQVWAEMPQYFDSERLVLSAPLSLWRIPGLGEVIRQSAMNIIEAFVKSTGVNVVSTEMRFAPADLSKETN